MSVEEGHSCCLCHETINEYHELFDTNNDKSNIIYDIVESYFPEEMLTSKNPLENTVICLNCWNIIVDFHEFRRSIYDVHDNFRLKNDNVLIINTEHTTEDLGDNSDKQIDVQTILINDGSDGESNLTKNKSVVDFEKTNFDELEEKFESRSSIQMEMCNESKSNKTEEMENFIAKYMPELECHKCHQTFHQFSILKKHFNERHPKLQFYITCCEKKFSVRYLLVHHLRLHINPDLYKCGICGQRKTTQRYLDNHIRIMHKKAKYSSFNNNKVVNQGNTKESRLKKIEELDNFIAKNMPIIKCHQCHQPFKKFTLLRKHFKQRHPKLRFYVNCCQKNITQRAALAEHLDMHAGECKTSRSSSVNYNLRLHNESHKDNHIIKSDSVIFPCPHCYSKYTLLKELNHHIKEAHSGPKQCEDCGEDMPNRYFEQKHAIMHGLMEAKPRKKHSCDICKKVFCGLDSLKKHNESKHNDGTTEYICKECGKVSYTKAALMAHKNNVHAIVKKNFKCKMCGKAFRKSRELEWHMTIHTKEKLYKCPDCDTKFTRPSNMFHHRKRVHPDKYKKSKPRIKVDPKKISNKIVL